MHIEIVAYGSCLRIASILPLVLNYGKKPKHYSGKAASSYLDFAPIATKLFHYLLISLPLTAHWIFLPWILNIWQKYLRCEGKRYEQIQQACFNCKEPSYCERSKTTKFLK